MVKITAHAGCEGTQRDSEENLRIAMDLEADLLEIDLRLFQGEIYLSHDPLDTGRLQSYVTLRQALELMHDSRAGLNCDLKEPEVLIPAMELLREAGMEHRTIFTGEVTAELVQLPFRYLQNIENTDIVEEGELLTREIAQQLTERYTTRLNDTMVGYNLEYHVLTEEAIRVFAAGGVPICCWQVDDEESLQVLISAGVEYLTTDALELAMRLKRKMMREYANA